MALKNKDSWNVGERHKWLIRWGDVAVIRPRVGHVFRNRWIWRTVVQQGGPANMPASPYLHWVQTERGIPFWKDGAGESARGDVTAGSTELYWPLGTQGKGHCPLFLLKWGAKRHSEMWGRHPPKVHKSLLLLGDCRTLDRQPYLWIVIMFVDYVLYFIHLYVYVVLLN